LLILPPGHNKEINSGRRIVGRERRLVIAVGVLTVAILVGVVIGIAGGGTKPNPRCLNVSFASSLGVQNVTECGAKAGDTCAAIGTSYGFTGLAGRLVTAECHRLKLKVG
jgi:hypothetical protein